MTESAPQQAAAPAAQSGLTQQQQADAIARAQKIQALIGRPQSHRDLAIMRVII